MYRQVENMLEYKKKRFKVKINAIKNTLTAIF